MAQDQRISRTEVLVKGCELFALANESKGNFVAAFGLVPNRHS
jgi:hypothetical protein